MEISLVIFFFHFRYFDNFFSSKISPTTHQKVFFIELNFIYIKMIRFLYVYYHNIAKMVYCSKIFVSIIALKCCNLRNKAISNPICNLLIKTWRLSYTDKISQWKYLLNIIINYFLIIYLQFLIMWKCGLSDRIKWEFFQTVAMSVLL